MLGNNKKFSTSFGYSVAIILLIAGVFSVWGFIHFLQGQAQQNAIKETTVSPATCAGWQHGTLAQEISLPENADTNDFSFQNSADSVSSTAAAADDALKNLPEGTKESLVCSDFSVDEATLHEKDLRSVNISFSLAAQADANTQDVVSFEFSVDGSIWQQLESVAIVPGMSNFMNEGYRTYNISGKILPEELSRLQVRVTHHKLLQGASHLFVDGIIVQLGLQKKVAIPTIPDSIVKVAKFDFSLDEEPNFSITTEDKNIWSVLGKDPKRQTVKGATIHHVSDEVTTADYRVETGKQGLDTTQKYVFSKKNFTKPGLYIADFEIEKDGISQTVEREFLWGVVAVNVRRSIQDANSWTEIGIAVLDENGTTVCDADLSVTVTYPSGRQEQVSKNDGTIITNETCVDKSVTNEPDYFFQIETAEEGAYIIESTTMTSLGEFTLHDSFQVSSSAQFDVERTKFPTRIYPIENYPVELTITPTTDYAGTVIERVPASFSLPTISDNGISSVNALDSNYTDITWTVDWKAGQSHVLGYTIDPPDVSPEFFLLGPLIIGDFHEARQWQIASDSIFAAAAVSAAAATLGSNHQGNGRSLVFTSDLHAYIIYTTSTKQLKWANTGNGGQSWGTGGFGGNVLDSNTDIEKYAVWYDQWTPGGTGNLIHVAWVRSGNDTIYYENIDTGSSDATSGEVAAYSDTASTRDSTTDTLSITKASDGDLYIASSSSATNAVPVVRFSINGGSSWSTTSDEGLDSGVPDPVMLAPLTNGDILLMRWDESADDIQSKEYEDGADSWGVSWDDVDTGAAENSTYREAWGATVNSSTSDVYLAYVNDASLSTSDLNTATYNGSSWSSTTPLETNAGYVGGVSIGYDSGGGDIYVGYVRAISTAPTSSQAVYRVSDDLMSTWSVIRGGVSAQNDDMQAVNMNAVSADHIGMWVFDEDDDDIWYGGVADLGDASGSVSATNIQGFESGDAFDASATNGSPTFSTGTVRSGDYSLEIDTSSATEYLDYTGLYHPSYGYDYSTTNYGFSGSFAFRMSATPSVATTIFSTVYNTTTRFEITLGTDNKLDITGASGDTAGTYALLSDTWYIFNVRVDGRYLDTAEVGLYSSDMSTQYEYLYGTGTDFSYFNRARLGITTATTTVLYYDDLILFADANQSNFPYIVAPYKIARKDLTGAGAQGDWTGNYTAIDEIPTSTADYISETTINSYTTSLAESSASAGISGQILGIHQANTMWEATSCSSSIFSPRIIPTGDKPSDGFGPTLQYTGLTTTVEDYAWTGTVFPQLIIGELSSLFTTTSIDGLEWGVGTGSTMTSCTVRNGSTVIQVAYIPPIIPDISGSLYSDEGSTKITASAKTITLTVNGSTTACGGGACTAETSGGDYTISDVTIGSAGDVITVYVDGETEKAVTVTRAESTSSNLSGLDLYQNHLIIRNEDAGPITNADLGQYDYDDDTDIPFSSNSNALTVNSGTKLFVWAGDTYDPGGTVTTNATGGDFDIRGTAYLDTATNTIGDQILIPTGGSLTISADTNVNGNSLTVGVTGGTLIQTGGTFNVGDGTTETLTINGGSATFSGGTTTITGEFDIFGGATIDISNTFNLTNASSTFEVYGGSTANINNGADVNLSDRLYLHDDGTVMTVSDGSSVDSYDYWLLYSGSFNFNGGTHHVATGDASGSLYMNGSTPTGITFNMTGNGTIYTRELETSNNARNFTGTCTGGTIVITGDNPTLGLNVTEAANSMNFYNITIAGTTTAVSTSKAVIINDFIVNSGQTFTTNNAPIPVGHDLINNSGVIIAGSSQISVEGSFTDNGTFTAGSSTVTMTGTGNINGSSDTTFYNMTIPSSLNAVNIGGYGGTNDPVVTNSLVIDSGSYVIIESGRTFTVDSAASFTFPATAGIDGAGIFVYKPAAAFPTGGSFLTGAMLRFDSSDYSQTMSARAYYNVQIYGNNSSNSVTAAAGSYTIAGSLDTEQIGSGTTTFNMDTNDPNITINGDFTIGSNTYIDEGSGTTDLNGDLTKEVSATWARNISGGTLLLSGASLQTIDATGSGFNGGGNSLYNLTITNNSGTDAQSDPSVKFLGTVSVYGTYAITTANVKVQYDSTGTSEVLGVNWNSPDANKIYFRSTSAGTQFHLYNYASLNPPVYDVDVKDAANDGGSVFIFDATDSSNVDNGNNIGWDFGFISIIGTIYTDDGVTPYNCTTDGGGQLDLGVSVNGGASDTGACTSSNGTFSFPITTPTAANQPVIFYIASTETKKATTITLTQNTTSSILADIYENRLLVDSESGTAVTNTHFSTGDNGNVGIRYSVSSGNLTVETGLGLYISPGKNFTPGGTVTTTASAASLGVSGDVTIPATATLAMATNALSVGGDFSNSGSYTLYATQITTFTGTGFGYTIEDGGQIFGNVVFNGTGGEWSFSSSVVIAQDLTMTNGALTGTNDITSNGGTVAGNGFITLTGGTFTKGGTGNFGGNGDWQFYNLTFASTTAGNRTSTATGSGNITITNILTIQGSISGEHFYPHIIQAGSKNWKVMADGTPFVNNGRFEGQTSTFIYEHFYPENPMYVTRLGDITYNYYNNLTLFGSGFHHNATLILPSSTTYITGNLYVDSDSNGTALVDGTTNNPTLSVGGDLSCAAEAGQNINTGTATWTVSGNVDLTNCTFTPSAGHTLVMNGTSKTLTAGVFANSFYNLTLSGSITLSNETHVITGNAVFSGTITAGTSEVKMTGTSNTINGGGNTLYNFTVDPASAGTITTTSSSFTVSHGLTVAAADTLTIGSGLTLTWTGSVFSMQSDSTIDGAGTLTVKTATILGETGWISSIVRFDASTGVTTIMPDRPGYYYGGDVQIYSSSSSDRTIILESGTHAISGDLYVWAVDFIGNMTLAGATNNPDVTVIGDMVWIQDSNGFPNTTSGTGTWTVLGNVDTSVCTFELASLSCYAATSGNTLDMAGTGKTLTAVATGNGSIFYNLTASGTISLVGRVDIQNQLLITDSLTSTSGLLYIGATFRNNGTFTHNSGTVYFNGASCAIDGSSDTAFYNLSIYNTGSGTTTVDTDVGFDDPSVAGILIINTGVTLAIESGRTVTFNSGAHTFTFLGTLSGAGRFIYMSSTAFPATGTANSIVRFDATDNDVSVAGTWSFGGAVEVYNTSNADPGVVTFATATSQAINCPQGLTLTRTGTQGVTLDLNTQDPVVTVGDPTTDRVLTINTGTTLSLSNTSDLTLLGSYVNAGTLTHNSSSGAVIFSANGINPGIDSTGASSAAFSNVIFQDITEFGILYTLESALDVDNNLTITAGTLDTKAAENNSIAVGGSWANTGTFTANSGTVTFDSTSSGKTIATGGSTFANIVFNGSGGEWTMLSPLDVNGTFDLTTGSLIQAANDNINVFGDFTIDTNGLFTSASGTGQLIFDGDLTFADNSSPQQDLGDLQIGTSPDTTNLSTDLTANFLTINDGDILYTNGYDLNIGIGGITVKADAGFGGGTLDVDDDVETDGTYMKTDGKFDLQSGATLANSAGTNVGSTLEFNISGSAITDITNDLITAGSGNPFNLVVDDGGGTYTLTVEVEDPVTVENNVTITGGVLDTKSGENNSIDVAGNWTNNDAFTARSGTVSFTGADSTTQVISGSTSFYDFTASTSANGAGRTLRFTAGTTQTVGGTWTITGYSGKVITLESSTTSAWTINPTAASVTYVDVSYSTNSGTSFCATYSNDGGNNTGWSISAGATCGVAISGQIYTDEGSSLLDCSTSRTVNLRINGAGSDTTECSNTPANGSYSFASTAATATDVVDVYLDNETEEATTVFVSDGTAQTNADLYQNWVIVRDDNGSGITNANLNTGDDTDDDVKYNVSGSNVTIDSGFGLHVWTGDTFAPGGTITTQGGGDVHIASGATLNAAGNAITANGDWLNAGTFTHGNNAVTFNATDTGHVINSGGSSFYDVTFNGLGGAWSPLTSTMEIARDLIMTAGEFNTTTGTAHVRVNGNTQCLTTCGTINMTSTNTFTQGSTTGTHTFGTNVATATDWTFYNLTMLGGPTGGSPTIQINGTGTGQIHVINKYHVSGGINLNGITVDNETNDRVVNVDGDFEISGLNGEYQASSTAVFTIAGNYINDGGIDDPGTLTPGTGTITLDGTSQQTLTGQMVGAGKRFYNLTITNTGGSNPDIIFNNSAETENTFTANTADTQIEFTAGDTYTFNNIDLDGQATGTRVFLRSSSTGTQWDLVSNGTQSVSNTDVRDSNACGGDTIDATDGTNRDSTNNDCWLINAVTFDISDNTIGFGNGLSSASRYATGDTTGSASEVEAHTLSISSNAVNGYSLTVYGPTLTSGAHTITAIGGSNTAPNAGTEQFGLRMEASGGSGTVSAPYAAVGFAYDGASSPDEVASTSGLSGVTVYSVRYLLNIAETTDIGSYDTDLTYIVTSNF